jgi:ABC-type dipeptide/oligopeptide/nickel transport system permease subunit
MAGIGILIGLIGAAVGIVVGLVGGLFGLIVGLLGGCLGLLPHLFPIVLITIGIICLVKKSNPTDAPGMRAGYGPAGPARSPKNMR